MERRVVVTLHDKRWHQSSFLCVSGLQLVHQALVCLTPLHSPSRHLQDGMRWLESSLRGMACSWVELKF